MNERRNTIALFDFDGTLTTKDTLAEFIKFCHGKTRFVTGILKLSPLVFLYHLGILSNNKAKGAILSYFFKGWEIEDFQRKGHEFGEKMIPNLLRVEGLEKLNWHLQNEHRVIIITASVEDWICSWTNKLGVELIGTRLEVKAGKLTGNYLNENCHGEEKVKRLNEYNIFNGSNYIYGYGDTKGDLPFLKLSNEAFYRIFKK